MSEHEDQLAALRAQMDQAAKASVEVAHTLWAFYESLVESGFTPEQALAITVTQLQCMWRGGGDVE